MQEQTEPAKETSARGPRAGYQVAFLFAYQPNPGQEDLFRTGYKRHLEWHREHDDPLVWYGWTVLTGDRPGLFVDGVFGAPLSALDARVDPAGDAADMARNVTPYGEAVYRTLYRLRIDLSSATPLEDRDPSRLLTVVQIHLHPGMESRFETVVRWLRAGVAQENSPIRYTWYELMSGGADPTYLLMIPAESLADLGSRPTTLTGLVRELHPASELEDVQDELEETVREMTNETWRYLPDLTYFPEER